MTSARLTGIVIRSTDFIRDVAVYTAVTGTEPTSVGEPTVRVHDAAVFVLGDARLTLASGLALGALIERGIERLVIEVSDLDFSRAALRDAGADVAELGEHLEIDRTWAGVGIEVRKLEPGRAGSSAIARAALDHVAILFSDVEAASHRWTAILGAPPDHLGIHPLGNSIAARFLLGDRMIELLAPKPGASSPLRSRLERAGDGPLAVAIVASDLDATMASVTAAGARIVDQPPHIVVHPSSASGVPIQLTPRIRH